MPTSEVSAPVAPGNAQAKTVLSDRAFALDALTIIIVSAAILTATDRLLFMTVFVPVVLALRVVAYHYLPNEDKLWPAHVELLVILVCALIGGFNDWNSVVNHRIYDYTVPVYFPAFSTIPIWMLLFWGMILRFFFSLGRFHRMGPPVAPRNEVWLGRTYESAWLKLGAQLALILATRQFIYRLYDDPFLSWLPFAVAIGVYAILFSPKKHEWRVLGVMLIGGPIVEALYIQIGGMHYYHQGVFFGVPVWIALWWALAALIWSDLSFRVAAKVVEKIPAA